MRQVETEGETLDEAITKALNLLGVERDKVSVDVLAEEKMGLLGFGRQNARVRATIREAVAAAPDEAPPERPGAGAPARPTEAAPAKPTEAAPARPAEAAPVETEPVAEEPDDGEAGEAAEDAGDDLVEARKVSVEVLTEILRLMGVDGEVVAKSGSAPTEFVLDIQGEDTALLIGRRGQTLEALQHIVSRIVADKIGPDGPQPVVDAEDYRGRRVRSLEDMALRTGEKAKRSRKTQSLDALSARDRRVVHLALKDDPWLTTKSLGEGAYRRLLIVPEGDRKAPDGEVAGDDQ